MTTHPQPTTAISLAAYGRLVGGNQNFRRLWLAQIVSEVGDWFYSLAIYALLLQLTGRASSVAFALLLQVLPQTVVGPAVGVVTDRFRRQQIMIAADLVRALIVLCMLLVRSAATVWIVYPLLLCETVMAAFFEPARNAAIPNITRREDVILANTLASTTWSINLMIGASLGGVVAWLLGRNAVFLLNALSFILSAYLIGGMRFEEPHAQSSGGLRDCFNLAPLLEGVRYVSRDRDLRATVFAKAGELMIGPSWVLFAVMGQRVFPLHWRGVEVQRGAMLSMSLLLGARGIGALVGPLFAARLAGDSDRRLRVGILWGYLAVAIGYGGLGLAANLWWACLAIIVAHCGGSTVWVFSTTLLQLQSEDRFRGRVFAADLALSMFSIALGAYLCGYFLDRGHSPRAVAFTTGMLMLAPAALWGLVLRGRLRIPPDAP